MELRSRDIIFTRFASRIMQERLPETPMNIAPGATFSQLGGSPAATRLIVEPMFRDATF